MDLVTFLVSKYKETVKELTGKDLDQNNSDNLDAFIKFTQSYLQKNPPVNINYATIGLGVTLADNTYVRFTTIEEQPYNTYSPEISVFNTSRGQTNYGNAR